MLRNTIELYPRKCERVNVYSVLGFHNLISNWHNSTHSLLNYVLKPQKSEHKLVGGRLEFEDTEKLFNEHKPLELSEAITRMHTLDSTLTATFEEQHGLSNIFEEKKW